MNLNNIVILLIIATIINGECLSGWIYHGDSCYLFSKNRLNWTLARDACENYNGGFLAEIETKDESDFLESQARNNDLNYWLGAMDVKEGLWKWVTYGNNLSSSYTDWGPREPNDMFHNEDCLHFYHNANFTWDDYNCAIYQHYICEISFGGDYSVLGR